MTRHMWVDKAGAKHGAIVLALGLALLLITPWLGGGTLSTPSCGSLSDPERARECVSWSAQAIDRGSLAVVATVVLALSVTALGGALVFKARRRVMGVGEVAELVETDVPGVRSLIANGDLVPIMSEGRTYVDATDIERLIVDMPADRGGLPAGD